jgi:hypothetical protein
MKGGDRMDLAPIILFVYDRPWHTKKTVEALLGNELAKDSDLIVYSDGPKDDRDKALVGEVRDYLKNVKGFRSIRIVEKAKNEGLARSVISGVSGTVDRFGKVIVMEDDIVASPYFLKYMNEGLDLYAKEEAVMSICGYRFPAKTILPETFFLRKTDSWGWATWKRAWDLFEPDGKKLLEEIIRRKLEKAFDLGGAFPAVQMLKDQIAGENDSWAIRWYASSILHNKLNLYPGESLVQNRGLDASGTHSGRTKGLNSELALSPIKVYKMPIIEDEMVIEELRLHWKKTTRYYCVRNILRMLPFKIYNKIKRIKRMLESYLARRTKALVD